MSPLGYGGFTDGIMESPPHRGVAWVMEPKMLPARDEQNRGFIRDIYRWGTMDKVLICGTGQHEFFAGQFLPHLPKGCTLRIVEHPDLPRDSWCYIVDEQQYQTMVSFRGRDASERIDL